ncbi:hypothetical protein FHX82_000704 [Amycolatopsis bartoniae]|uniref:RdlA protein n=1 Tax=Amycolatopsis bartoniae TaxID=941986 RepID=A0A8H9IX49_9PSEU|nr:hypothetical protein [Amycolatopsis bartoniae]MBB2933684.1 hypothetical protein [Amycolatopsis bartoniae]TVT10842.1 hypothetical protein FNH07_04445 [Amycolatopsis bartoniae]GHF72351.1 hypothetical protein GCM10017566_52780 [Amycolatopsis bartoniae]
MLKKIGFAAATFAAGVTVLGGTASATELGSHHYQGGDENQSALANLNNLDALHNVNLVGGVCKDNVNVLGVQVPVQDVAKGLNVPILSEGNSAAAGEDPQNCASGSIGDGGTSQDN